MKLRSVVAFLHGCHWSYLVDGNWEERGGIMLSARPGSLKSQIIKSLEVHDRALVMSDINVPTISRLRDDIAYGRYRTLAFTEFEKIYQRDPGTASNIEAHLRAFVDEGFKHPSFEDARMVRKQAYCMVVGAITPNCYQRHYNKWEDSGFGRRFLWLHYGLSNPGIITEAIHRWERIKLQSFSILSLDEKGQLAYNLTESESRMLQSLLPVDSNTSYTLLKKVACVLKHVMPKEWQFIVKDVSEAWQGEGALLDIEYQFPKSHSPAKTRPAVHKNPVRRRAKPAGKAPSSKIRVLGLEAKRELPSVPADSLRTDGAPTKGEGA